MGWAFAFRTGVRRASGDAGSEPLVTWFKASRSHFTDLHLLSRSAAKPLISRNKPASGVFSTSVRRLIIASPPTSELLLLTVHSDSGSVEIPTDCSANLVARAQAANGATSEG